MISSLLDVLIFLTLKTCCRLVVPTQHFAIKCTEFQIAAWYFDANSNNLNAVKVFTKNVIVFFLYNLDDSYICVTRTLL